MTDRPAREALDEAADAWCDGPYDSVVDWMLDHLALVMEAAREAGKAEHGTHHDNGHWQVKDEGPTDFACNNCEGEYVWREQVWILR